MSVLFWGYVMLLGLTVLLLLLLKELLLVPLLNRVVQMPKVAAGGALASKFQTRECAKRSNSSLDQVDTKVRSRIRATGGM